MHPALAVIFLTLFSGGGFGLMTLTAIVNDFQIDGGLNPLQTMVAVLISLLFVTIGLLSSTAHLANPKNAWRAFTRWRTSWLAREGVFAVMYYPFAFLYLVWVFFIGYPADTVGLILANIAAIIGLITIFCQGMIYAVLRTMRQWNTPLVPANFYIMGLAIGASILVAIRWTTDDPALIILGMAMALLVTAAIMKGIYYFWISRPAGPSIHTATGFNRFQVRIMDQGHTFGTFLTEEFGHSLPRRNAQVVKLFMYLIAFVFPLLLMGVALHNNSPLITIIAALLVLFGIGIERWLFFIEAQHVVNLYHGRQQC
ncbi:dimethyl sulfoxide reductase anchor subunit [Acidithiobacillus sp. CV18-2]|uniref:Dimethyl sulfoxide reductase anchor subunit n=1 Tax=Igneacidithiobacillus copahuensis TaxID=2724909 RepID=A0AAE2YNM3_9PROT|nr:DmsC/YnfH family molybdoenzyme membrane anchor subunit [Igneacidithiobacillus copahuensis]MBU2754201.1 dimethyl sulfoxide reductase anchor subunit [Acidithiobacillus sp. CV18-3]MBU2757697.1 dimethyl sulfoxide reductase anchor subunit [Acidithiobacillus sp. BN09-2]MBU2778565.1 dimethyl sulfoxide reductase anchor subunit [Acidithiobacillus sp. CV18-2]MBU2797090.1 dimethyl sulfoxide reductase anchor subunit [Acidithiobacillus sp. VAN18-2]MBU2799067.1 dimethyl sulfoxide reductase anchor subunit